MKNTLLAPVLKELIEKKHLDPVKEFCETTHPADVASYLSAMDPNEVWIAVSTCEPEAQAEIFSHLDPDTQLALAMTAPREDIAALLGRMSPDDRVDLVQSLPEDKRDQILRVLAHTEREDIRRLSSYPDGTAGSVMTSDYVALGPGTSVRESIDRIRSEATDKETIYYTYVVDASRKLIGFVSLKDLILAPPNARVEEVMHRDVIFAHTTDDQEDAARKIQKYDLIALPVVAGDEMLVGIITHDDAFDIITQEQTEDLEKFMAITGRHEPGVYLRTPAWTHFKNRIGWVIALAALGLVSGFIVQNYEGLLINVAILATFMPMLADTGGNTGSQSSTLVVRALALREIAPRDAVKVLIKETQVALPLGLVLGGLAFARVVFFAKGAGMPPSCSPALVGIAVAVALGFQVVTATLIGALLPLVVAKLKFDPAVVASPALTTIVDITGLFLYFFVARLILGL